MPLFGFPSASSRSTSISRGVRSSPGAPTDSGPRASRSGSTTTRPAATPSTAAVSASSEASREISAPAGADGAGSGPTTSRPTSRTTRASAGASSIPSTTTTSAAPTCTMTKRLSPSSTLRMPASIPGWPATTATAMGRLTGVIAAALVANGTATPPSVDDRCRRAVAATIRSRALWG